MTGEPTWRRWVVAWLAARSVRQLVLMAGALVLLVSGAFGGLRQAEADDRDRLAVGEPHLAEPIRLTVKGVYWADDLGETIGPSDYGRYLLVIADVSTNQANSVDSFVVRETLRIKGLQKLATSEIRDVPVASEDADPRVIVTEDRVRLSEIGPGLTYEVAYIWEQKTSEPLPTSVEMLARSHQFRQSSLDTQQNWFGISDDAIGTFPVTEFGAS